MATGASLTMAAGGGEAGLEEPISDDNGEGLTSVVEVSSVGT